MLETIRYGPLALSEDERAAAKYEVPRVTSTKAGGPYRIVSSILESMSILCLLLAGISFAET